MRQLQFTSNTKLFVIEILYWGDLGIDGWIVLGWISRRWIVGMWTGLG